jgi:hypothetical protein
MVLRFAMIVVPFKVEHVPLQLVLGILRLLLLFLEPFVLLKLFELVTLVITAAGLAVLLPAAEADPAELMLARMAGHMVAALVLLNRLLAVWAHLAISNDPLKV